MENTKPKYVGLINEGATDYINVVLQVFYFLPKLRKAIYEIDQRSKNKMVFAFQSLFYKMQNSSCEVSTKHFTKAAMSWREGHHALICDAGEMFDYTTDIISDMLSGSPTATRMNNLFPGELQTTINYLNRDDIGEVVTKKNFVVLNLKVDGIQDIYEAFAARLALSLHIGEDIYHADNLRGYRDVEAHTKLTVLPPILCVKLIRCRRDLNVNKYVKLLHRVEFYDHLDLSSLIGPEAKGCAKYSLLSVIVHDGKSANYGYYRAHINPKCDGEWYTFEDEVVTKCSKREAIDDNFCSDGSGSTATFLVYINDEALSDVLCEVNEDDIPINTLRLLKAKSKKLDKFKCRYM